MGQGTASPPPRSPMRGQGTSALPKSPMSGQGAPRPLPKSPMSGQGTSALPKSPMAGQGTSKSSVKPSAPGVDRGRALQAQKSASALGGFGANKTLKAAPTSTATKPAVTKKPATAAKKQAIATARPKNVTPVKKPNAIQRQMARSKTGRDAAVTGPGGRLG
jgi:hypothetical protein